jgi:outer membrane protein TolC
VNVHSTLAEATELAEKAPVAKQSIDLDIALRLAGVSNPTINLARERVEEALADQLAARAMLLPSLTIGGNYRNHQGAVEASTGVVHDVHLQSVYAGFGARAIGGDTVTYPGVRLFAHLGDAVYEPLAARQRVSARRSDAQAIENDTLLAVAASYLELIGAEARLAAYRQSETELAEIVRLTSVYAKKGQGREGEANRAAANADLLRADTTQAEEAVAVASARLDRLLNLDPAMRLQTPDGPLETFRLSAEDAETESLIATAMRARPEVFARSAELLEARIRIDQERTRPWIPTLSAGYSYGLFGGNNVVTSDFGPLKGRSDFDVYAVWTFQNLGLGNRAQANRSEAVAGQAVARLDAVVNRIRQEVVEAQTDAQAATRQLKAAKDAIELAEEGFKLDTERIRQGEGRPIEVLDSFHQMLGARLDMIRAIVGFDAAQFRLYVAIGSNPLRARP